MAQDLKALSMLLNATPFVFVIDLACLASRREYLKLDKWLTDKIRENGVRNISRTLVYRDTRCYLPFDRQIGMDNSLVTASPC